METRKYGLFAALLLACQLLVGPAMGEDYDRFLGSYTGVAEVETSSGASTRDLSVEITPTDDGYQVRWKTVTHKSDGRIKEKEYTIGFLPTARPHIFSSTMGTNLFGNPVPLDPMKGDPYVWSRVVGDTLTVYALLIDEDGGYEMQEYNRTLTEKGLHLEYERVRNGEKLKTITADLIRDN